MGDGFFRGGKGMSKSHHCISKLIECANGSGTDELSSSSLSNVVINNAGVDILEQEGGFVEIGESGG